MLYQKYFNSKLPSSFSKKSKKTTTLSPKYTKKISTIPYKKPKRFHNKQLKIKCHYNQLIFYFLFKINFASLDSISRIAKLALRILIPWIIIIDKQVVLKHAMTWPTGPTFPEQSKHLTSTNLLLKLALIHLDGAHLILSNDYDWRELPVKVDSPFIG